MKLRFFDLAKKLSIHSEHHQHRLGAVLTKKNRIIGMGFNKNKTHTLSPHPYKHLHAEISALLASSREELIGSHAYVYRETKQGILANARPCMSCFNALKEAGVSKIYYTNDAGYHEEVI